MWHYLKVTLLIILFFSIGLINTVHESYPDEFDNILGGRYLIEGKPIYSDFFTHHGPTAYFVAVIPQLFSGISFFGFRIVYAILLCIYLLWSYWFIRKRFPSEFSRLYLLFLFFLQVTLTYFWGHMLLADSIAALFLLPVFAFCTGLVLYERSITPRELFVPGLLVFLALTSSFTYFFVCSLFYSFLLYRYFFNGKKIVLKEAFTAIGFLSAPFIFLFVVFAIQGNLGDFYRQAYEFNKNYYIYNYPRPEGSSSFNPIRYAVAITYMFFSNTLSLLTQVPSASLQYPVNVALAVGFVCFVIYLLFRKQFIFAAFTLGVLTFANVRSNPLTSKEPDYQIAVYFVLCLFVSFVFLWRAYVALRDKSFNRPQMFILYGLFGICGILFSFSSLTFIKYFSDKAYSKYMGLMPLIYDRPDIAPMVNAAITKDDYAWIGPFAFEDLWYMNAQVPSRYQIMIPAMKEAGLVQPMTDEIRSKRPKVIYFDKYFYVLGKSPETFGVPFLDFLSEEYVHYVDYRKGNKAYVTTTSITLKVDIEAKLYIRKDAVDEVTARLLEKGFIKEKIAD